MSIGLGAKRLDYFGLTKTVEMIQKASAKVLLLFQGLSTYIIAPVEQAFKPLHWTYVWDVCYLYLVIE